MKTYSVNLDYESFLFDPNYIENSSASQKVIREFEYIFFLVNKEDVAIKNIRNYEKNYLNKLKSMEFIIPKLSPDVGSSKGWWGHHHNYTIEKNLNSKLTSAEIGLQNGWGLFDGAIVTTVEEIETHLSKYPQHQRWIIKRPHGFSGIGHYFFTADKFNKFIVTKILAGPVLLEPQHQRVFDIGTTFIVNEGVIEKQFMVENFNSSTGGFKGGTGASDPLIFKNYIQQTYNYSLDELELITQKIAKKYIELGAIANIQIDSFIYEENGQLKLYPLVEVNYRKTMGLVIQSLAEKYPEFSRIEWIVKTQKEIAEDLDFYNRGELVRLSPDGTHFQTYLKKIK